MESRKLAPTPRSPDFDDARRLDELQRLDVVLGIDPSELRALERMAGAVERPTVPGADELVADDGALGEVPVEMRTGTRRAAAARRSRRATRRSSRPSTSTARMVPGVSGRMTAVRSRGRAVRRTARRDHRGGAVRDCLTEHEAQQRRVRPFAAVVRGEAREVEQRSAAVASTSRARDRCRRRPRCASSFP